jgi:hypothetical protein
MSKPKREKICPLTCKNESGAEVTFDNRASCRGSNYPITVGSDCDKSSYECPENQVVKKVCKNMFTDNSRDTAICYDNEYLINTCSTPGYMRDKRNGGKYKNKKTKKTKKNMKKSKKSKKNNRRK